MTKWGNALKNALIGGAFAENGATGAVMASSGWTQDKDGNWVLNPEAFDENTRYGQLMGLMRSGLGALGAGVTAAAAAPVVAPAIAPGTAGGKTVALGAMDYLGNKVYLNLTGSEHTFMGDAGLALADMAGVTNPYARNFIEIGSEFANPFMWAAGSPEVIAKATGVTDAAGNAVKSATTKAAKATTKAVSDATLKAANKLAPKSLAAKNYVVAREFNDALIDTPNFSNWTRPLGLGHNLQVSYLPRFHIGEIYDHNKLYVNDYDFYYNPDKYPSHLYYLTRLERPHLVKEFLRKEDAYRDIKNKLKLEYDNLARLDEALTQMSKENKFLFNKDGSIDIKNATRPLASSDVLVDMGFSDTLLNNIYRLRNRPDYVNRYVEENARHSRGGFGLYDDVPFFINHNNNEDDLLLSMMLRRTYRPRTTGLLNEYLENPKYHKDASPETLKAYKDIHNYIYLNNEYGGPSKYIDRNSAIPEIHTKPLALFDDYPLTYTKQGAENARIKTELEKALGHPIIEYHTDGYVSTNPNNRGKPITEYPKYMETVEHLRKTIPDSEINPIFLNDDYINLYLDNMKLMNIEIPANANLTRYDIARIYQNSYNNLVKNQKGIMKGKVVDRGEYFNLIDPLDPKGPVDFNGSLTLKKIGERTGNSALFGPGLYFTPGGYHVTNWSSDVDPSNYFIQNSGAVTEFGDKFRRAHNMKYLIDDVNAIASVERYPSIRFGFQNASPDIITMGGVRYGEVPYKIDYKGRITNSTNMHNKLVDMPAGGAELVVGRDTGIKSLTPHPETATGTEFVRNWADPNVFRAAAPWLFGAGAGGYLYNQNYNE